MFHCCSCKQKKNLVILSEDMMKHGRSYLTLSEAEYIIVEISLMLDVPDIRAGERVSISFAVYRV